MVPVRDLKEIVKFVDTKIPVQRTNNEKST